MSTHIILKTKPKKSLKEVFWCKKMFKKETIYNLFFRLLMKSSETSATEPDLSKVKSQDLTNLQIVS
jgi:hypothetical protein